MNPVVFQQTIPVKPEQQSTQVHFVQPNLRSVNVERLERVDGVNPAEKPTKMLLEMLKPSVSSQDPDIKVFKGANYYDWEKMFSIAQEASVSAIALDSYGKLPKGTVPANIVAQMLETQLEVEQKHAQQERVLGELSERFSKKGIETIQLKGIGLSMDYPVPRHRYGGDIDLFTRLKGTVTEQRSNSSDIIDDMMVAEGRQVDDYNLPKYKHSEFDYNGVRIENHRYFVNKECLDEAGKIDEFLHKSLNPRVKILPNGTKILVPSKEFNTVFLAQHAFQHYIFGGIDIHHLTDWGMHIKENGLNFPDELKGTRLEKFTYALTNLSNKYLGTKVDAPVNKEYEETLFKTILNPAMDDMPEGLNNAEVLMYKLKRFIKRANRARQYGGRSVVSSLIDSSIRKIKNPSSILVRI